MGYLIVLIFGGMFLAHAVAIAIRETLKLK